MALKGKVNVRSKIVLNNHIIEQENSFNYLGYTIAVTNNKDLEIKLNRFHQMCGTVRITLNRKTRKETDNILQSCGRTYIYFWIGNLDLK
jgi:hypothetical protein